MIINDRIAFKRYVWQLNTILSKLIKIFKQFRWFRDIEYNSDDYFGKRTQNYLQKIIDQIASANECKNSDQSVQFALIGWRTNDIEINDLSKFSIRARRSFRAKYLILANEYGFY